MLIVCFSHTTMLQLEDTQGRRVPIGSSWGGQLVDISIDNPFGAMMKRATSDEGYYNARSRLVLIVTNFIFIESFNVVQLFIKLFLYLC